MYQLTFLNYSDRIEEAFTIPADSDADAIAKGVRAISCRGYLDDVLKEVTLTKDGSVIKQWNRYLIQLCFD